MQRRVLRATSQEILHSDGADSSPLGDLTQRESDLSPSLTERSPGSVHVLPRIASHALGYSNQMSNNTASLLPRGYEHEKREEVGSKYLKGRGLLTLVFQKRLGSRSLALQVESRVKKLSKVRKEKLIEVPGYIEDIIRQSRTRPHQQHQALQS
jgi:putative endonuclease